jgi:hypothetical protein
MDYCAGVCVCARAWACVSVSVMVSVSASASVSESVCLCLSGNHKRVCNFPIDPLGIFFYLNFVPTLLNLRLCGNSQSVQA